MDHKQIVLALITIEPTEISLKSIADLVAFCVVAYFLIQIFIRLAQWWNNARIPLIQVCIYHNWCPRVVACNNLSCLLCSEHIRCVNRIKHTPQRSQPLGRDMRLLLSQFSKYFVCVLAVPDNCDSFYTRRGDLSERLVFFVPVKVPLLIFGQFFLTDDVIKLRHSEGHDASTQKRAEN